MLCFLTLYTMFAFSKVLYNHRVIRWDKIFLFTYDFQISRVSPVQMFDPTVIYSLTQLSDLPPYSLKERQKTGPIFKKECRGFFSRPLQSLYCKLLYTLMVHFQGQKCAGLPELLCLKLLVCLV